MSSTKAALTTVCHNSSSFLPSAVIYAVLNSCFVKAHAPLDSYSKLNLFSETFARKNHMPMVKSSSLVGGVTANTLKSNYSVAVKIRSRINNFEISLNAEVILSIPCKIKHKSLESLKSVVPGIKVS